MRSPLDLLKPDLRQRVETEQSWQKNAHDQHSRLRSFQQGDTVYAKNLVLQQLTNSGCQVTSQTVLVFYPTRSYWMMVTVSIITLIISALITPDLPDMDQGNSTSDTSPVITEEDTNETVDHPEPTPDSNSAQTYLVDIPQGIIVPQTSSPPWCHISSQIKRGRV